MQDVMNKLKAPQGAPKLEKILGQLRDLAKLQDAAKPADAGTQSVANDGPLSAAKMQAVVADEALVRPVLALLGVDYDALVAMDGKSAYSQAVGANPALLEQVLGADRPVLAALQVAFRFKPYADFAATYGSDPAQIKDKLRQEVLAEMAQTPAQPAAARGAVFSAPVGKREGTRLPTGGLRAVFAK